MAVQVNVMLTCDKDLSSFAAMLWGFGASTLGITDGGTANIKECAKLLSGVQTAQRVCKFAGDDAPHGFHDPNSLPDSQQLITQYAYQCNEGSLKMPPEGNCKEIVKKLCNDRDAEFMITNQVSAVHCLHNAVDLVCVLYHRLAAPCGIRRFDHKNSCRSFMTTPRSTIRLHGKSPVPWFTRGTRRRRQPLVTRRS